MDFLSLFCGFFIDNNREKPACENQKIVKAIISSDKISKSLMNLICGVQAQRNDIDHAGWRKNPARPQTFKKSLNDFIRQSENIIFGSDRKIITEERTDQKAKNMLLIFSHTLTPEQEKDARENLEVDRFINLPPELQEKWSNIPPELQDLEAYLQDIFKLIDDMAEPGDFALIEGEPGSTYSVVNYCIGKEVTPVYSTTTRKITEENVADGVKTHRLFKHVRFRKYYM